MEIIRCLKRYLARAVFRTLRADLRHLQELDDHVRGRARNQVSRLPPARSWLRASRTQSSGEPPPMVPPPS